MKEGYRKIIKGVKQMPYIKICDRERLKKNKIPKTAGEMNFLMIGEIFEQTKDWDNKIIIPGLKPKVLYPANKIGNIVADYLEDGKICYQRINDCGGAILFAGYEFIRRNPHRMPEKLLNLLEQMVNHFLVRWYLQVVIPYEYLKIRENGDLKIFKKEEGK